MDESALLDYDRSRLASWSQEREDQALRDHRDLYVNHLAIAKHLDRWVKNLEQTPPLGDRARYDEGYRRALAEVAAHLRQGDYLPDGVIYRDITQARRG